MLQELPFPIRVECPPGLCECKRELLLGDPAADKRVLMLTREQEKKLLDRIARIDSYGQLLHVQKLMFDQLGIELRITPSVRGVRTVLGLGIELVELPGLCRRTRESVPAAIRRCMRQHPQIVFDLLDAHGLPGLQVVDDDGEPDPRTGD
ncbi:hypothetical protein KY495_15780 [Massilia sp. PAMC28688]|uniref:hypothetical protein n=1 Tax=Massilia sp. PAMC28688 TaxID=2861283 RepID=UPI001C63AE4B|nr:hypothetical protein [Massilia sp. PAMC28688]QYF92215.1 hypothetical protein KY495_15780 [Massilia sp. PAMC28688]